MARKKRSSTRRPGQPSVIGSLLLELVAIVGFIFLMSAANGNRDSSNLELASSTNQYRYESMINGFLSDHWDRTGLTQD